MENKSKYLFLLIGIIIGVILTFSVSLIFDDETISIKNETQNFENETEGEVDENKQQIIQLNEEEIDELGIVMDEVSSQKLQLHSDLTGEIVPDPNKLAHIIPRFSGIVKNVYKEIGDKVEKNEVIAVIESNESLVTYEVKSSIDGVVLDLHMTPGELIGDDLHVVTIANLNTVWAELNIYQKDLRKIKVGQTAEIYFEEKENAIKGKIFYISPTIDEHTRTATARVRLNNSKGYWKPGMFVGSRVFTDFIEVEQAVTLNAIQNFDGQKVVFVKDGEGFKPQPVTIGKSNSKYIEILSGLNNGQAYIAEGAFVIKSELLKESFGGDHDH